ncbi:methyl-accepting chemotaxis protein [Poriferisphaera sp. WC338]|uniref:methyl-accepting chemotaxis protein n=1 Tax=Poriferisphaera sp. WC338 TaxID=3425129 RepID=UPI003D816C24
MNKTSSKTRGRIKQLQFRTKLLLGITTSFILCGIVLSWFTIDRLGQMVLIAEQRELHELAAEVTTEVQSQQHLATALSKLISTDKETQQLFANKDRDGLLKKYANIFADMKSEFGVKQFQFHLPPAESFLRLHKPQKFGDDLSSFRQTVLKANQNKITFSGLEKGFAGYGIRGVKPVTYKGNHIGTVEFGMSFDQSFFDKFKEKHHIDLALQQIATGGFETFASTYGDKELLSNEQLQQVIGGKELTVHRTLGDIPVAVHAVVVKDYANKPIGVLEVVMDRSHYLVFFWQIAYETVGIGIAALIISLLVIGWLVTIMINKPVQEMVVTMNKTAEGDIRHRFSVRREDEIGELQKAYNSFADNICQLVSQVKDVSSEVNTAAAQVADTSEQIAQGMAEQSQQVEQTASAIEQLSASVDQVANQSIGATESAQHSGDMALKGGKVVKLTVDDIHRVADAVKQGVDSVNDLGQRSEQIGEVISFISEIADQTNLLALNAAIEAARAGEHGRSFAVVADEVRKLADRTTQATDKISESIKSMQADTEKAVHLMSDGNEKVSRGVERAREAGDHLEQIVSTATEVADQIQSIAVAAGEQSKASSQIAKNIETIHSVTRESTDATANASRIGQLLTEKSSRLSELISTFKIAS